MERKHKNQIAVVTACCVLAAVLVTGISMILKGTHTEASTQPVAAVSQIQAASVAPAKSQPASKVNVIDPNSWMLRLVSSKHLLPENFTVETVSVGDSNKKVRFDKRAAQDLQALLNACNSEGHHLVLCSGYRDVAYQTGLYNQQVRTEEKKGLDEEKARAAAATVVEVPRGSEHNLGLAIDFGSISNQRIDETFDEEPESQWLKDNAWKYGFILRYPQDKQAITGVEYEAWHYRYVGKQAAKDMHDRNICLEEYLSEN